MVSAALKDLLPFWQSFYVLIGSSAAGLTGLTFVVITISADAPLDVADPARSPVVRSAGLHAFITPTVIHFATALWLSALMSMPGETPFALALCLAITALIGIGYGARVVYFIVKMLPRYKPFLEDWIWVAALPIISHVGLLAAALAMPAHPRASLYGVGVVSLLLLFIGIHNAWDVVTWLTTEMHAHRARQRRRDQK